MKFSPFALILASAIVLPGRADDTTNRWFIDSDGGITWKVRRNAPHNDNIEMSGKKVSVIVTYGVDKNSAFRTDKLVVFPTYRTVPAATKSLVIFPFKDEDSPRLLMNRNPVAAQTVTRIHHRGIMTASGTVGRGKELGWTRTIFPSIDKPMVIEEYTFTNNSTRDLIVELEDTRKIVRTDPAYGLDGASYEVSMRVLDPGERTLKPGESATTSVAYGIAKSGDPLLVVDAAAEEKARCSLVDSYLSELQLETPDRVLNTAFGFAKIRTTESIFLTKGGLMHGPGGGRYYAAIWANDQAEYANPFFPFLGDPSAVESAINAYHMFAKYMNDKYTPIPSSIVAEGAATWHGAGDRGDMAMIAYGAARFSLAYGNADTARDLWPLVEWCLEYLNRQVNSEGVVASHRDELEGRFPCGPANLCTSSLCYDALNSAAMLGRELGKPESQLADYQQRAKALRDAMEKYFNANVEGFETYRYYNSNTVLRAWICIPLTVGIYDRAEGTINALFSPRLWTQDGLATEAGKETFWDRSTLYALRGVFAAGETPRALEHLEYYSNRRLLGEHVPYPVEAYPEGNQSHLAAESALYCRIYIEGMFGIRPTGLRSFDCTPRLPKEWPSMALKRIHAFGNVFDLAISRMDGGKLQVQATAGGQVLQSSVIDDGKTVSVSLPK